LEDFLIFGSYPEVIQAKSKKEKKIILNELVNFYLLKDILALERVKNSKQLLDLLKLLSFQIGKEVSLSELAAQVRLDVKTVGRYIDLLEKTFVLKKLGGFSRNLRKEVVSKAKYYFLDTGIRNAIISQFNPLDKRDDFSGLFENFVIMERMKNNVYKSKWGDSYFWRTYGGQEIDLVEDRNGKLFGYEIKWSEKRKVKQPQDWTVYKNSSFKVVNRDNYLDFIGLG